jgi:hypothetical protein
MTDIAISGPAVNAARRRVPTRKKMSYDEWRDRCPYGAWRCADGREVLFNRSYMPIIERRPGEQARPANPNEWIESIVGEEHFWTDYEHPQYRADTLGDVNQILIDWGFPQLPAAPAQRRGGGRLTCFWELPDEIPPRVNPWCFEFGAAPRD